MKKPLRSLIPATALLVVLGASACEEEKPPPNNGLPPGAHVADADKQQPSNKDAGQGAKGRSSALGKSLDVAEDLRDKKVAEYNKQIEEEIDKKDNKKAPPPPSTP